MSKKRFEIKAGWGYSQDGLDKYIDEFVAGDKRVSIKMNVEIRLDKEIQMWASGGIQR